jgi:hypothetical protein
MRNHPAGHTYDAAVDVVFFFGDVEECVADTPQAPGREGAGISLLVKLF